MSATTYRNLIRRREHQERSQPAARAKYGLLEKHKDYVQRAQNFHTKEKRLTDLRHRAAFRNPDEFYNKMVSSSTKDGIHRVESDRPSFTADELKLLKTQDTTYLQATKMMDDRVCMDSCAGRARGQCSTHCASLWVAVRPHFPSLCSHSRVPFAESRAHSCQPAPCWWCTIWNRGALKSRGGAWPC